MSKDLLFSVTRPDLNIEFFCAGGPGGQHQNKTSSACRITHSASGATGECREHREQTRNKVTAFRRMAATDKFQLWLKRKAFECFTEETIEQKLDKALQPQNLRIDIKNEQGQWIPESI